jgi:acetoin utilization deacetylase AcuC-like enzyme
MRVYYRPDYVRAAYAFDTTRKARWIAESLAAQPIAGIELAAPDPVSEAQLCTVHDAAYVAAIRSGEPRAVAESSGLAWDAGLWTAVRASTGGMLAAVRAALDDGVAGSLSSGLHHAKRDRGDGYCTFNGLALAAYDALEAGARAVLILDLDAHCGGGTYSLIASEPRIRHADIAVNVFDRYHPAAPHTLQLVETAADYLAAVSTLLDALAASSQDYDLCLYNAGMDPFEGCAIGGLHGVTRETLAVRERMVFAWARDRQLPITFVLAGGYSGPRLAQEALVGLHRLTIEAAASVH